MKNRLLLLVPILCAVVYPVLIVPASPGVGRSQISPPPVSLCSGLSGSMSAEINGVRWVSTCVDVERSTGSLLIWGADTLPDPVRDPVGAQLNQALFFKIVQSSGGIGTPLAPGTYPLGGTAKSCSSANLQVGCSVPGRPGCLGWAVGACYSPAMRNADGIVTIRSFTAAGATGTFSFSMAADPDTQATGMKAVTGGVFDVRF